MYDPSLGRFHTQDAFAEKYYNLALYQYCANNPIIFIDFNGNYIVWGLDEKSQAMRDRVFQLRQNSAIFESLYIELDNLADPLFVLVDDQLVQAVYQHRTKGEDPEGKAGGYYSVKNELIGLSDVYADEEVFSEEFFHAYQNLVAYADNPRNSQELDAEAKLLNALVGVEISEQTSEFLGKAKVIDNIKNNSEYLDYYYYGLVALPIYEAVRTSNTLEIKEGTSSMGFFINTLQVFKENHDQTEGDVYGGDQRLLVPKAYNTIIEKSE